MAYEEPIPSRGLKFPDGTVQKTLAQPWNFTTKTANYTAAVGDYVLCNATSGVFTVTLPSNPTVGAVIGVKKIDATSNLPLVAPSGSGTIDGDANATLASRWAGAVFEHQGSDVWTVAAVTLSGPGPASPLNNLSATTDPAVGNDNTQGYSVGSRWINTTTGWEFSALAVTTGAAIWMRISPTSLLPAFVPQTGASNILHPWHDVASAANVGGAQNQGMFTQFILTKPTTISGLAFQVTTAAAGGAGVVGRCGLFNDNGAGGVGTLIADYGTTAVTSTGLKTVAGSRTLQPGIYWTGFKYEYTTVPTTAPQFTSMSTVISIPGPALNSVNYRCLAASGIVGAFVSNPAATPTSTQAPIVGMVVT